MQISAPTFRRMALESPGRLRRPVNIENESMGGQIKAG